MRDSRRRSAARCTVAVTAAGMCLLLAGTPSSAASTPLPLGGWQPFHAQSFTAASGTLCAFALHLQVLFDHEYVRTTRQVVGERAVPGVLDDPPAVRSRRTDRPVEVLLTRTTSGPTYCWVRGLPSA